MPSLTFVMPHWLYWACLLLFPAVAFYCIGRERLRALTTAPSLFIAYLFWLLAGFLGIHRFYVRNAWGVAFIPVFLAIIYCNVQIADVRDDESRTFAALEQAQTRAEIARPKGENASPEAVQSYNEAQALVRKLEPEYTAAKGIRDRWKSRAGYAAVLLALMLLVDAFLLPGLLRRRHAYELAHPGEELASAEGMPVVQEAGVGEDPTLRLHSRVTDAIEWVNVRVGQFVAWWAIIAVFAYYYEVMARFVFNSPTNWVHESMFLMFGMQYILSGAYAYRDDQHVRVDVIYTQFSTRGKAIADIITSVFFFIFALTLFWTSARFAMDAVSLRETSFTEWGIQYWPVKLTMPIGAGLLVLQGVSKLLKDIMIVTRTRKGA